MSQNGSYVHRRLVLDTRRKPHRADVARLATGGLEGLEGGVLLVGWGGFTSWFRARLVLGALLGAFFTFHFCPDGALVSEHQGVIEESVEGGFDRGSGCALFGIEPSEFGKCVEVFFADPDVDASDSEPCTAVGEFGSWG